MTTATTAEQLRAVSYGGGVQSTALLVLAAQGVIDFPLFVMANVGDDSEEPATLAYVRDVAVPFAANTASNSLCATEPGAMAAPRRCGAG